MSEDTTQSGWGADMDVEEHARTYKGFLAATKWGTVAVAVILIGMAIFLV